MKQSFKKIDRVRKSKDFRNIYESGYSVANRCLVMHVIANPDKKRRVGITAGKKIGGAVFRNRCKRKVRECCRIFSSNLPAGQDIVISCRKGVYFSSWNEMEFYFKDICRRMHERIHRNNF